MPMNPNQSLIVAGIEIVQDKYGRYNLNVLHRASPSAGIASKSPSQWLRRKTTKQLISELESRNVNLHCDIEPVWIVNGGPAHGVYAIEPLAVAYAAWISPTFHLLVIQAFIDVKTGRYEPALPEVSDPGLKAMLEQSRQIQTLIVGLDQARQEAALANQRALQAMQAQQYLTIREYVAFHGLTHQIPPGTAQQAYGKFLVGHCKEQGWPLRRAQTEGYPEWQYPVHVIHQTLQGWLARRNGQMPMNIQIERDGIRYDEY